MDVRPVDEINPTPSELARGVNQLHDCLEGARGDIGRIIAKLDEFNRSAWKAVGTIALAIFVAALGLFFQNYQSHRETMDTTTTTATTLARYTAQDAARDRAEQEAVNKQILDQLAKLSRRR